jgi:DNA-binding NarL/FixJ family response regulator
VLATRPENAVTGTPGALRVLISDDDATIRDALREVLQAEPDIEVVAVARDSDEAITLARRHTPAVAVIDVRMPGGGVRAAREIRLGLPGTGILIFSAYRDVGALRDIGGLGGTEYLLKGTSNAEIVAAVRRLGRSDPAR